MAVLPNPLLSYVVLIGVGRYQQLGDLPAVHENLVTLSGVFCDERFWGLPRENCVVVHDPETQVEMLDPLREAAHNATDTLLLYYVGHGLVDPRRSELHLSLIGSDPQRMYTSVPYGHIRDILLDSRASRRIVMLDCCYSGRALGQMADPVSAVMDEASAEGTYVLAAAAENKTALAPPGDRYTAFTGELLHIINNGISECGPFLDLDSIYRHLRAAMKSKGFPIPQKRDRNTAGQLNLVRNQADSRGEAAARTRSLTITVPQVGELQLVVNDEARQVAWKLYIETVTRVSTQPLADEDGFIREVMTSLYGLFATIRDVLMASRPSVPVSGGPTVEYLAVTMLNRELRPFLSKWHPRLREYEKAHPDDPESAWPENADCRRELSVVQDDLAQFARGFAHLAGVPDDQSAMAQATQPQTTREPS